MRRACTGRSRGDLCFCPEEGYDVRQVLAKPFINGWVSEMWMRAAYVMATDGSVPDSDLWRLLWNIEDAANDAYEMWRQTC